ncbi:MAG: hypothetical protein ABH826_01900 [Patescibacteria group bacterium]
MKITNEELEKRAWYRIMKVVLVIAAIFWIVVTVGVVIGGIIDEYPFVDYDYKVTCSNTSTNKNYTLIQRRWSEDSTFSNYSCNGYSDILVSVSSPTPVDDYTFVGYFFGGIFALFAGPALLYLMRYLIIYIVYGQQKK